MKSFTSVAAFVGAASAAWAPPAYGGASTSEVPSAPAYETPSAPAYETPSAPAYEAPSSSSASSSKVETASEYAPPVYGASSSTKSSSIVTLVTPSTKPFGYGTGSSSAPAVTGPVYGGNSTASVTGGYGTQPVVTAIVTSYETFCPGPTTVTAGGHEYTVTSATTLTITDCPGGCVVTTTSLPPVIVTNTKTMTDYVCPTAGTYTYGPSTYTVTESETISVPQCSGGCEVTETAPVTVVVPTYSTVCPSPSAPVTTTIESSVITYSQETTIVLTQPTSYATYTSVYTSPESPTSYVQGSSTVVYSAETSVVYSAPTQAGYTMTIPYESVTYAPPPAAETPYSPVGGAAPSGYPAPPANGTQVSPEIPQQTGNSAAKVMGTGAGLAAILALFL